MSKTWEFREDKPFLERTGQPWTNEPDDEREDGWGTHIIYDGEPITVTWFPERKGIQVSGGANVDEKVGKDAAIFGLALIKIMRSGAHCVREV